MLNVRGAARGGAASTLIASVKRALDPHLDEIAERCSAGRHAQFFYNGVNATGVHNQNERKSARCDALIEVILARGQAVPLR